MKRAWITAFLLASSGCSAILGFEEGVPYDDAALPAGDGGADSTPDASALDGAADGAADAQNALDAPLDTHDAHDAHDAGLDATNDAATDAASALTQAFETPLVFNGRLDAPGVPGAGGLAAGDARCMEAAQSTFPGRTFKAWLSVPGTSAASRLAGGGPWYVGNTYFASLVQMTTSTETPAVLDKAPDGTPVTVQLGVWTGTDVDGTPTPVTCSSWTDLTNASNGEVGTSGGASFAWTYAVTRTCANAYHLYCFER